VHEYAILLFKRYVSCKLVQERQMKRGAGRLRARSFLSAGQWALATWLFLL
jgi:hypothetical protein